MRFQLTYIPRGINAPRAHELGTLVIFALHARHAAQKALAFERRSGARVLTVKETK